MLPQYIFVLVDQIIFHCMAIWGRPALHLPNLCCHHWGFMFFKFDPIILFHCLPWVLWHLLDIEAQLKQCVVDKIQGFRIIHDTRLSTIEESTGNACMKLQFFKNTLHGKTSRLSTWQWSHNTSSVLWNQCSWDYKNLAVISFRRRPYGRMWPSISISEPPEIQIGCNSGDPGQHRHSGS